MQQCRSSADRAAYTSASTPEEGQGHDRTDRAGGNRRRLLTASSGETRRSSGEASPVRDAVSSSGRFDWLTALIGR
jgi:hypothetical protein